MKKIALTSRLDKIESYNEIRESIDIKWCELLSELGFEPMILSYCCNAEFIKKNNIKGLILTGGNDLSVINDNDLSVKRDLFEKQLVDYCLENNIPIFGVCRGMQFLISYFGDKPEIIPNHTAVRHNIKVNKNNEFADILKNIKTVNSFHNFGFKNIDENWIVLAKTLGDRVVEAVHHSTKKIFAQMWHPERENPFSIYDKQIIKLFFKG